MSELQVSELQSLEPRTLRAFFHRRDGSSTEPFTFEVAETDQQLARGLMGRGSLTVRHGMFFIFRTLGHHVFWMANTYIPLDLAWLDEGGTLLEMARLEPLSDVRRQPKVQARFAIELASGTFLGHRIAVGDKLVLI
jgi:uncharacterized membrane protein (UPF0127 family)